MSASAICPPPIKPIDRSDTFIVLTFLLRVANHGPEAAASIRRMDAADNHGLTGTARPGKKKPPDDSGG